MKDALLVNKVAAAVISAALLAMVAGSLSDILYHTEVPEENAYVIATGASSDETAEAKPEEPAGPEPIAGLLAEAKVSKGERLTKKCAACHSFDEGGAHKVGPNLYDVVNRAKAGADGFGRYSGAMKDFGGEWTYEDLNQFLYKPRDYVKGTAMNFAGFKDAEDRANLIAYLRTLSSEPAPLP